MDFKKSVKILLFGTSSYSNGGLMINTTENSFQLKYFIRYAGSITHILMKMDLANRVQILYKAICISHVTYTLRKCMNKSLFLPAIGEIGLIEFSSLCWTTSVGEQHWIKITCQYVWSTMV